MRCLLGRVYQLLFLLSFHLLSVALLSLESNLSVNFVHNSPMKLKASSSFLDANNGRFHLLPSLLEDIHEPLTDSSAIDSLADDSSCLSQPVGVLSSQTASHRGLNRDDLVQARGVQELLQACPGLFLQKDLGKANLELFSKLGLGFSKVFKDGQGCVSGSALVLRGLSLETRSVPADEVLEDNTDRVAGLTDTDSFKHTSTP